MSTDGNDGNDARFCREHAVAGNPLFRVSAILVPEGARRLTALYAVFDLVGRIGLMAEEEGAARTQLEWWRHECLVRDPADSSHPALRELTAGGRNAPDRSAMARLLEQAERRLDRPAVENVEALRSLCEELGRPMLELEAGLEATDGHPCEAAPGAAARRGLWTLLCDSFRHGMPSNAWWLPLDLMAREGLRRDEVFEPGRRADAGRLFGHLFGDDRLDACGLSDISDMKQADKHVFLMDLLTSRRHRKLHRSGLESYPRELARAGVGEFLSAWRLARRINRRK